jgi:hypothetical protein
MFLVEAERPEPVSANKIGENLLLRDPIDFVPPVFKDDTLVQDLRERPLPDVGHVHAEIVVFLPNSYTATKLLERLDQRAGAGGLPPLKLDNREVFDLRAEWFVPHKHVVEVTNAFEADFLENQNVIRSMKMLASDVLKNPLILKKAVGANRNDFTAHLNGTYAKRCSEFCAFLLAASVHEWTATFFSFTFGSRISCFPVVSENLSGVLVHLFSIQ